MVMRHCVHQTIWRIRLYWVCHIVRVQFVALVVGNNQAWFCCRAAGDAKQRIDRTIEQSAERNIERLMA